MDADIQAAHLLATFGGTGLGPHNSKPAAFRPPALPSRSMQQPLPRVAEEMDKSAAAGVQPAPLHSSTPPPYMRAPRVAITPLSAVNSTQYKQNGSPMSQELPPLQAPYQPPPSPPRRPTPGRNSLNRSETADSYTSQALRSSYAAYAKEGANEPPHSRSAHKASAAPAMKAEPMFSGPSRPRTAAARALLSGTTVHPVVRLGWKPLCEVHCNGLTGSFLGGHDRDLYIKCTAPEYAYLPMVDVSQGGCIMTCSHFEKAAGRELSKKWKESIHVAGEGEGSKATLVAWLKRRAEADFGSAVVGQHVWVCWVADAEYYLGEIVSYSKENGKHKVKYSDRFVEELHLPVEKLDFGHAKPSITFDPADVGFAELAQRQLGDAGSINRSRSAPAETLRAYAANYAASLLHQCSNVSTSCEYHHEEPPSAPATADKPERRSRLCDASPSGVNPVLVSPGLSEEDMMRPPPVAISRRRRTGATSPDVPPEPAVAAAGGASSSISEESDGTPVGPPPKKRRSGRSAGMDLASKLAEVGGSGVAGQLPRTCSPAHLDRRLAAVNTWLPSGRDVAHSQASPSAAAVPASPRFLDLAVLAPPPARGHEETNPAVVSRWMNRVAMCLDDSLAQRASQTAATERDAEGSVAMAWTLSPSARFQTLLVHARRRDSLQGYYEAMLDRYTFFKDQAAQLQRKMEDFILAALYEEAQQWRRRVADRGGSQTLSPDRSTGEGVDDTA